MKVLGIQRAECFSPNSAARDFEILRTVMELVGGEMASEDGELPANLDGYDVILTMGRKDSTLDLLQEAESHGVRVVNSSVGIRNCTRSVLDENLRANHFNVPPTDGPNGWWLKRGDQSAQESGDVVFCANRSQLDEAYQAFRKRGITNLVRQAHIRGDVVKFYGVEPAGFFYYSYPGDTGYSKFGCEEINGLPRHYRFDLAALQAEVEEISRLVRVPVYGGDAIITEENSYFIIDFNDWPSFSACRDEAAKAIASCVG